MHWCLQGEARSSYAGAKPAERALAALPSRSVRDAALEEAEAKRKEMETQRMKVRGAPSCTRIDHSCMHLLSGLS